MTTHNRWMAGALALSLIAVVALGVYVVLLQFRLSGQIADVDTKLSTRVETVREDLGVQIESVELRSRLASQFDREFVSGELDTLSRSLAQRANVLASQLDTLDATLSREMSQTSVWLRGNVQGVRDRLSEVQTELTGADTALQERVHEQEVELRDALDALTADRARISSDLDDLAMDISALMSETSRALLDVTALYNAVRGSVVEVAVNGEPLGSGFVTEIDSKEFVVTAWHVVRRPGEITVRLSDGRSIEARRRHLRRRRRRGPVGVGGAVVRSARCLRGPGDAERRSACPRRGQRPQHRRHRRHHRCARTGDGGLSAELLPQLAPPNGPRPD